MTGGVLPDGTETNSDEEYIEAWRKLAEPIERMTGLMHVAFDPNVQFVSRDREITLPKWFIELINKFYQRMLDDFCP